MEKKKKVYHRDYRFSQLQRPQVLYFFILGQYQ